MLASIIALSTLAAFNATLIVTPDNLNGWKLGSHSPKGQNSGRVWFDQAPLARSGVGSLWFATGSGSPAYPFVYARSDHFKGQPLFDFEQFTFESYVAPNSASRWNENGIGFLLTVDLDGDGKRLAGFYSNAFGDGHRLVKKGVWQTWSCMNNTFISTSDPTMGAKSLLLWMGTMNAREPKVDHFVVCVGAVDDPNRLNFLGAADLFTMKLKGQPAVTYDFELPRPTPAPKPATPPPARPTAPTVNSSVIVLNAVVISQPTFYYFWNQPIGELYYMNGERITKSTKPDEEKLESEPETKKSAPYWTGDDLFIPIGFRGNVNFAEIFHDSPSNPRYEPMSKGGSFVLGGVPFLMDSEKQVWFAGLADDVSGALLSKPRNETPRTATLKLEVPRLKNLRRLYSLINTYWGDSKSSRLELQVNFESGKRFRKPMLGNADVRGFEMGGPFTTKISGTTREVWRRTDKLGTLHDIVLDMQKIDIPQEYWEETVSSVVVVDTGAFMQQRAFVVGVTAQVGNVKRIATLK